MLLTDYMRAAYRVAARSPDPSTQCGAVVVSNNEIIGKGFNHFPGGIHKVLEKPEKYKRIQHAEVDAIFNCWGVRLGDSFMVCPWAACPPCALAIIGVKKIHTLVIHGPRMKMTPDIWKDDIEYGLDMIRESGIKVITLDAPILDTPHIFVNGVLWSPSA